MIGRALLHALMVATALHSGADNVLVKARVADGHVIVSILPCCATPKVGPIDPKWAPSPKTSTVWMPVVAEDGTPYAEGHTHDAYFTGKTPRVLGAAAPRYYRYVPPKPLEVDLRERFADTVNVTFLQFDARADGELTDRGMQQVVGLLKTIYGPKAFIKKLGEGGFQVVFLVVPHDRPGVVAKIRKIAPTVSPSKRLEALAGAAWDLRRDLAMEIVANQVTMAGVYARADGSPVPVLVDGRAAVLDRAPTTRLARVARVTSEALLRQGIVEQELLSFTASTAFKQVMSEPRDGPQGWRKQAVALAEASTVVDAKRLSTFLDKFYKPSKFGPDVIKIRGWVRACGEFASLPPIRRMCALARESYSIPDDFDDRLRALEQLYRDTAAAVIRFHRHNFYDGSGNDAADGLVREVGLDFNHGRNAGWDPHAGQFVVFDW